MDEHGPARCDVTLNCAGISAVLEVRRVNIVVCVKETPSTTAEKRFGPDMRLERRKEDAIPNPFDEYAIEEGLRQQEKHGGTVTYLCMGPATATDILRKALAMGGDRGVLVTDPALAGSDAIGTARAL